MNKTSLAKCIRKVGSCKSPDKSRARIDSNVLNKINPEALHTAGPSVAKFVHALRNITLRKFIATTYGNLQNTFLR